MRILNIEQFTKEPNGTMYCRWEPSVFIDQPMIKEGMFDNGTGWSEGDVLPWLKNDDYNIEDELQTEEFSTRAGDYDYSDGEQFAVFNKSEVRDMITRLEKSLVLLSG